MRIRCLLFCLMGILLCGGAKADLILTLDQAQITALPGETVTFVGNLMNNSGAEIFLNGAEFAQVDPGLTGDETPFFTNTPLSLAPGASLPNSVPLFTIMLDSSLQPGLYSGAFRVVGGPDSTTFDPLAIADYHVNIAPVTTVPEPGSVALLVGAASVGGMMLRRKR